MKKFILLALVLAQMLLPSALAVKPTAIPATSTQNANSTDELVVQSIEQFYFSIPSRMKKSNEEKTEAYTSITYTGPDDSLAVIAMKTSNDYSEIDSLNMFYWSVINSAGVKNINDTPTIVDTDKIGCIWTGDYPVDGQNTVPTSGLVYINDQIILLMIYSNNGLSNDELKDKIDTIASTVTTQPNTNHASDDMDLASLSLDELLSLRQQIDTYIWQNEGWSQVEIPNGTYTVGEDLPAGRYTMSVPGDAACYSIYPDYDTYLNDNMYGEIATGLVESNSKAVIDLIDGQYLEIIWASVTLTKYSPTSLIFK